MTIFDKLLKKFHPPVEISDLGGDKKLHFLSFLGFLVKNPKKHQNPHFHEKREKVNFGVSKGRPNNVLFCLPPPT